MPIYEFRCQSCGNEVELLVRGFSSLPDEPCPRCGGGDFEKLMSRVAFSTGASSAPAGPPASRRSSCSRPSCGGCGSHCH